MNHPQKLTYIYQRFDFIAISISANAAKDYLKVRKEQIHKNRKKLLKVRQVLARWILLSGRRPDFLILIKSPASLLKYSICSLPYFSGNLVLIRKSHPSYAVACYGGQAGHDAWRHKKKTRSSHRH
jgi:hypothetical protein